MSDDEFDVLMILVELFSDEMAAQGDQFTITYKDWVEEMYAVTQLPEADRVELRLLRD